jgi:hypothetical protein
MQLVHEAQRIAIVIRKIDWFKKYTHQLESSLLNAI